MALPTTMKSGKFKVFLGNGATPEVFTAPCGLSTKAFNRSKELTDVVVPDCDDPDAMAHVIRDARSLSASISGNGVLAKSAYPTWVAAYESADSTNCRIEFEWDDETTVITQRFHLTSLEISGEIGNRVQVSIQMESDGAYTEVSS